MSQGQHDKVDELHPSVGQVEERVEPTVAKSSMSMRARKPTGYQPLKYPAATGKIQRIGNNCFEKQKAAKSG